MRMRATLQHAGGMWVPPPKSPRLLPAVAKSMYVVWLPACIAKHESTYPTKNGSAKTFMHLA